MAKNSLTAESVARVAEAYGVNPFVLWAVAEVESGPMGGFLGDGHPVVLFEPHVFHRQTNGRFDEVAPHLSYPNWGERPYGGYYEQPMRLGKAAELDRDAALQSASWGRFQIMGFNWKSCGYADLQDFINAMYRSEEDHLTAMVEFCEDNGLIRHLRKRDWKRFARDYNGPGYKQNRYDIKLATAFDRAKRRAT